MVRLINGYIEIQSDKTFKINDKVYEPYHYIEEKRTKSQIEDDKKRINQTVTLLESVIKKGGSVRKDDVLHQWSHFRCKEINELMKAADIQIKLCSKRGNKKKNVPATKEIISTDTGKQYIFIIENEHYLYDSSEGFTRQMSPDEWEDYKPINVETDYNNHVPEYKIFHENYDENALPHYLAVRQSEDMWERFGDIHNSIPGLCKVFSENTKSGIMIIEGPFGSGKTYSLIAAAEYLCENRNPALLINARDLQHHITTIHDPVYDYLKKVYGITPDFLKKNNGIVFILDGIEAISDSVKISLQRGIKTNIINLCENGHKVIVSVRNHESYICSGESIKSRISMIARLIELDVNQIKTISPNLEKITIKYPELRTPLFACNFIKISEYKIEMKNEDLQKRIGKRTISSYYDLFSIIIDINIDCFGGSGTQSELYSLLLPFIAYESINGRDVTLDVLIKRMRENNSIFNRHTNLGYLDDEPVSINKIASMLEETGFAVIINDNLIQIVQQEYRNFLAASFFVELIRNEKYSNDNLFNEVLNCTRFYCNEKEAYLDDEIRLQKISYGEYVLRLLEEQGIWEEDDSIKRNSLLLGLHVGYELEYRIWDVIKSLIKWWMEKYIKTKKEYDVLDQKIIIGMGGYLYSLNKISPEYFGYYKKERDYNPEEFEMYKEEKRILIKETTLKGLKIILDVMKDEKMKKEVEKIQNDFYGSLLGNIGAANLALALIEDNEKRRNEYFKQAKEFHEEGLKYKKGNYALARGYISLATDYYYAGIYEHNREQKRQNYEQAIAYHRKALEEHAVYWDENQRVYTLEQLKDNREITDADPIISLRRIAGCQYALWNAIMRDDRAMDYYYTWSIFMEILKDLCSKDIGGYNIWRIKSGTISDEIIQAVKDFKERGHRKCLRQCFLISEHVRNDILDKTAFLQNIYELSTNNKEDLIGIL